MEEIGQLIAVAGVFGLLLVILWWLRRRGYAQTPSFIRMSVGRSARRMERIERLVLSPQHTLHLVRLGETALLVAASPSGCTLIQALPHTAVEGSFARQEAVR